VHVIRLGAYDYITKPLIPEELLLLIRKALLQDANPVGKTQGTKYVKSQKPSSGYLLSDSPESKKLEHQISLVAPTNYSVIIYGESGVGKEGAARMIHEKSARSKKAFVAMDCGAISKELAGSELFGHEQGAFTGAATQKAGHFELANGGTLFLDEIGNLPYEVQTLLLRVIQERVLRRIGGSKVIDIDVRIIVASNESLMESAQTGKFRMDLYHRLNEFMVEVAPLRKRKRDILFFAGYFLKQAAEDLQKTIAGFDIEAAEALLNYPWPGNIRQLKNTVKRAALLSTGNVGIAALPAEILNFEHSQFDLAENGNSYHDEKFDLQHDEEANHKNLKKAGLGAQYDVILSALEKANFNKTKAAEILGIDRKTLYNKMKLINPNEK
jgi:two-component system response regulator HydG